MDAEITNEGLKISGELIPPTSRALDSALGPVHREIQIPLHGGGVRRVRVFDDLGLAYYLDETPPEIPGVLFALSPQGAPLSIGSAFSGSLRVNRTVLTLEMTPSTLPMTGAVNFEPRFWTQVASGYTDVFSLAFPSPPQK